MASFNKVILAGNLTHDLSVKYTQGGSAIVEMGLATKRVWYDKQNVRKEEVTYVDVTFFGKTAETAGEFLRKGSGVLIEGRLKLDQWDDKKTGQKRSKLGVVGETLQFLDNKPQSSGSGQSRDSERQSQSGEEPQSSPDEDVPF